MGKQTGSFDFIIGNNTVIKGYEAIIFIVSVFVLLGFFVYSLEKKKKLHKVHKLYLHMCLAFIVWLSAMSVMWFIGRVNTLSGSEPVLWVLDSLTYVGVSFLPVFEFMIALTLSKDDEPAKTWNLIYILPSITNLLVWTNSYHHLIYEEFSVVRSDLVLGKYVMISGVLNYVLMMAADVLLIRSAIIRKDKLFWKQTVMLVLGTLVTLVVSMIATFGGNLTIAATPLSFTAFLVCNYVAIYRLHILDIVPIATRHILDYISDGYLILSENNLVVDDNRPFRNVIGKMLGIEIGKNFAACVPADSGQGITAKHALAGAIEECRKNSSPLSYEQYFIIADPENEGESKKMSYIVDITPMFDKDRLIGYAIVFKDITQLRKSLEQVQNSRVRLMEQERLAMLGQMVGGLAHNLKTPIMAIAGCTSSVEALIQEISDSVGDPEVTAEDYAEINGEIYDWLGKIRSSCSYMSDIITAVKGQAQIANANDKVEFSIDQVVKRTQLLMKHEFSNARVELVTETDFDPRLTLVGDINSLIQVLNNLMSNAIYASQQSEERTVTLKVWQGGKNLHVSVTDSGKGVDPAVKDKLFKEMITTKGTHGTGLGLYISATTIKGKFGGTMWYKDAPVHGAVFGFDIPLGGEGNVSVPEVNLPQDAADK